MTVAGFRRSWLLGVVVYTMAGVLSSIILGTVLGVVGSLALPEGFWHWGMLAAAGIGALVGVREAGLVNLPMPQLKRQTPEFWRFGIPFLPTAGLWGFDLGLVFTTWITFAGPWFLAAVAVAARDPAFGATLFATHWLGRAAWVWVAPYLFVSPTAAATLADEIVQAKRLFSTAHLAGVFLGVLAAGVWLAS